jgi:hypothetical protein
MPHIASRSLKVFYCLVLLGPIIPMGLLASTWRGMSQGALIFGLIPMLVIPFTLLLLGVYRVYLVAMLPKTIDSLKTTGVSAWLRKFGVAGIYFGGFIAVLIVVNGPLIKLLTPGSKVSGAEFFGPGGYISLLSAIGMVGIMLFEFSRLLAFEQQWRKVGN